MKKLAFIGLLAAIIIADVLLLQYHTKLAKDRGDALRARLAGVWLREELYPPHGGGVTEIMRCTNTIAADGSFVELSWFSHPDRTNTYRRTGAWLIKNGHLIETVESSSNPTEVTPHTNTARIVRADARGFTVRWPNSEETIWQKIIP